jgi:cytidylate kinase
MSKLSIKDESRGLVITVSGYHGSGRSSQGKKIAENFGLRYISTGIIFRERAEELGVSLEEMNRIASKDSEFDKWLDERTKLESRKGGVVIDANLSAWMAEDPDLRIFLTCSFEERIKRMMNREGLSMEEVKKETKAREEFERRRYLDYYSIDMFDLSVYDLVLDTGLFSLDAVARILKNVIDEYLMDRC